MIDDCIFLNFQILILFLQLFPSSGHRRDDGGHFSLRMLWIRVSAAPVLHTGVCVCVCSRTWVTTSSFRSLFSGGEEDMYLFNITLRSTEKEKCKRSLGTLFNVHFDHENVTQPTPYSRPFCFLP